jgi:hypothetical protein
MCLMRTNKITQFLHSVAVRIFLLTTIAAVVLTLPRLTATAEVLAAPVCEAGAHQMAGQCVADVLPAAEDTEAQDAEAEGQDVLPISWHAAPAPLWNALLDQHPEWYDGDVADGLGTVWVPVGTVIDVPGGLALATLDGWAGCQDWETSDQECNATGPVEMLDIEPVPATVIYGAGAGALCGTDEQCAALDADRELAGLPALDGPAYGTEQDTAQDAGQVQNVAHVTRTWGPIAEDGTRVRPDFYAHVTKTGATQARCDYLGKRRVADPVYGHRCV